MNTEQTKIIKKLDAEFDLKLTDKEVSILAVMLNWCIHGWCDLMWHSYEELEEITGISIKELRVIMWSMRYRDIVRYDTCTDDDGRPFGSGYFMVYQYIDFCMKEVQG